MAVVDQYVDTTYINSAGAVITPQQAVRIGSIPKFIFSNTAVAAGDDDGSVYRIAKAVNADALLWDIKIATTAITLGSDYDLGLYLTDLGAVVIKDVFMDGQTMANAVDFGGATVLDGMDNVAPADYCKALWEYANHSMTAIPVTKKPCYDIAFTANTVGTAAGTISTKIELVNP